MAVEKTELTDNLAYGVDLKNRRIYFGVNLDSGDVEDSTSFNMSSVEYAIRAMHRMAVEAPNKPIELHVCSYGGDIYSMLRLYDEIQASPCQIKFFGGGAIMSAASVIMAGCDERYLHPNATIMVHELNTTDTGGRHTDVQVNANEDRRLVNLLYQLYEDNSKMPKAFWEDMCQRDLYLSAREAVSLGLADRIIEPKKRGNLRKVRYANLKRESDRRDMNKLIKSLYARINKINVPKIELNSIKKDEVDPEIVVEEIKMPDDSLA